VPTVLDALELADKAPDLPGRSLWPSATGQKPLAPRPVFGAIYPGDATSLEHPSRDVAYRWLRDGRFKLIVPHSHAGEKPWGSYLDEPALFDLVNDPRERNNLANEKQHANMVMRLRRRLDQWWKPENHQIQERPRR